MWEWAYQTAVIYFTNAIEKLSGFPDQLPLSQDSQALCFEFMASSLDHFEILYPYPSLASSYPIALQQRVSTAWRDHPVWCTLPLSESCFQILQFPCPSPSTPWYVPLPPVDRSSSSYTPIALSASLLDSRPACLPKIHSRSWCRYQAWLPVSQHNHPFRLSIKLPESLFLTPWDPSHCH